MPRPRSFDTEKVTTQAMELFWAQGYEAVSIQDIAKATGLRPGSLHAAFGNKEDLFASAFDHYRAHFERHLNVSEMGLDAAEVYLQRLVDSASDDIDRKGCFIINTASELGVHSDKTKAAVKERLYLMQAFFERCMVQEGAPPQPTANALFGAATAVLTLARAGQDRSVLQNIVEVAVAAARQAVA